MRPWKHGAEATSRKQISSVAGGVRGAADRAGSGVGTPGLPLPKHSTPFPGRGGAGRLAGPYRSCQGASAASDDAGGGHGHTETPGRAPRQVQGGHSMQPPKKLLCRVQEGAGAPIPILSHAQPPPNVGCKYCAQQGLGTGRRGAGRDATPSGHPSPTRAPHGKVPERGAAARAPPASSW